MANSLRTINPLWLFGGALALALGSGGAAAVALKTTITEKDRLEFVRAMRAAIKAASPTLPEPVILVIIAHAAMEVGYGRGVAYQLAKNPFNITTLSRTPGSYVLGPDTDGSGKAITQYWYKFPSLPAAVTYYLKFLQNSRYTDAYQRLMAADVTGFVTALKRGTYFEAPLDSYLKMLTDVMNGVRNRLSQV